MAKYLIDNRPAPIGFEHGGDLLARTLQNAKNLLMTRMGEIPYDRYRGFHVALYDLPMTELSERLLPEIGRIMLWEPDVDVDSATCYIGEGGRMVIEATLEIDL